MHISIDEVMDYRVLGTTGLKVSRIGLGCSHLGSLRHWQSRRSSVRLLHAAINSGITLFDTAGSYAGGNSERLLGNVFRGCRSKVVLASKAGYCTPRGYELFGYVRHYLNGVKKTQNFSANYLNAAIESSLRRLQTDYLDVFLLHNPPAEVIRTGAFIPTLEFMKAKGAIRFHGVSCSRPEDYKLCLSWPEISVIQLPVTLLTCDGTTSCLNPVADRGVGIIARQPFGSGRLWNMAGKYRFLDNKGVRTLCQAALQFVLQQEDISAVLVGTRDTQHLGEIVGALDAPPLSQDELLGLARANATIG